MEIHHGDASVRRRGATAIAHNYVLGVDFQGETVWVATAQGVSRGVAYWESMGLVGR